MKKILFTFLLFIFSCISVLNAQMVSKKWAIVQDLDDRIVYLDTTTIKEFDNKITIWSLVIYRTPKDISPLQQKVSQIKSQFMINAPANKYSVIGTLYYDSKGRMIGETSLPNYSYGSDNFSIMIVPGSTIDVLHNKAKDYLTLGKFADERSEFLKNFNKNVVAKGSDIPANKGVDKDSLENDKNKALEEEAINKLKDAMKVALPVNDTNAINKQKKQAAKKNEVKKEKMKTGAEGVNDLVNSKIDSTRIKALLEQKIPKDTVVLNKLKKEIVSDKKKQTGIQKVNPDEETAIPAEKAVTEKPVKQKAAEPKVVQKPAEDKKEAINKKETVKKEEKKSEAPKAISSTGYDFSKETNPSGVIFSDGKSFCFQVSSWKLKSQAEKELARLQKAGHNAFIQEANLAGKGKWYRVRVGFFNSLQDAAAYRKKVK
jgi:cell division septation protein DedD